MKSLFGIAVVALVAALVPPKQSVLPGLAEISGRVVVQPAYPSPFPEEFTLVFADAAGTAVAEISIGENVKTTNFRSVRGGIIVGEVRLQNDGKFLVRLPARQKEFRLIVRKRPSPTVAPNAGDRYYLKSVEAGGINLLEKLLVVNSQVSDEIVITLAKCTDQTRDQCN